MSCICVDKPILVLYQKRELILVHRVNSPTLDHISLENMFINDG